MRTTAIWIFGLLAGGMFGSLVAERLSDPRDAATTGFFAGLCLFKPVRDYGSLPHPKIQTETLPSGQNDEAAN